MSDSRLTVNGLTVPELLAFHRSHFGDLRMEETGEGEGEGGEGGAEGKSLTQADVDAAVEKIAAKIRADERRKASEKFADYDDLKAKAGEKATAEDRIKDLEAKFAQSEARALRAEVANAKGLTPSQAKRLVGDTLEELEADADELLKDIGTQKKSSNVVPREGNTPPAETSDERAFARQLFGNAD